MSSNNIKLILSAAGAGKTTYIVNSALATEGSRVLITTFTDNNTLEIRKKLLSAGKKTSSKITVLPWFTFLLKEAVRPYQGYKEEKRISGVQFMQGARSGFFKDGGKLIQIKENLIAHYCASNNKIYSDKLAKFACIVDNLSGGLVVDRISRIYDYIYIDEVQDLNGYDLELLHKLAKSCKNIVMAGDVRQVAYNTHIDQKFKKYANGRIREFFENEAKDIHVNIDEKSLSGSYRCCEKICQVSNKVFPNLPPAKSNKIVDASETHCGVYFVRKNNVKSYLDRIQPQELRYSVRTESFYKAYNFGDSKGMGFRDVLIYPINSYIQWINGETVELKPEPRHKLYIAITRAEISVAFVVPNDFILVNNHLQIEEWTPSIAD